VDNRETDQMIGILDATLEEIGNIPA